MERGRKYYINVISIHTLENASLLDVWIWEKKKERRKKIYQDFRFFFLQFSFFPFFPSLDEWKMNVSLKRQLQRSLIKNKSVAFVDSNSSGSAN